LPFPPTLRFTGPVDTLVHGAVIGDIEAVVREGMTNVAKHAQASALAVHVSADSGWLLVEVSDNGIGNAEGAAGDGWNERRSGLENLSHRAKELGGTLAIEHRPTGGTLLQWTIPMPD
jgi:signal transduction histidine kinase